MRGQSINQSEKNLKNQEKDATAAASSGEESFQDLPREDNQSIRQKLKSQEKDATAAPS